MAATFKLLLVIFVFLYIDSCKTESMTMGTNVNAKLAFVDSVKLNAIPFFYRSKNVFFNGNSTIKGIYVTDNYESDAKVKVTAGGVGSTFTNIKLKSVRGEGLDYQIQIFV